MFEISTPKNNSLYDKVNKKLLYIQLIRFSNEILNFICLIIQHTEICKWWKAKSQKLVFPIWLNILKPQNPSHLKISYKIVYETENYF